MDGIADHTIASTRQPPGTLPTIGLPRGCTPRIQLSQPASALPFAETPFYRLRTSFQRSP